MRGIFGGDNPIGTLLNKASDLVVLNFLILLGCLPLFTIGAAVTAGHFAALRIRRDESSVWKDFWSSFRENLGQATAIWLIFLTAIGCVLVLLWFYGRQSVLLSVMGVAVLLVLFLLWLWVFPVLAKFENTTGNIMRNGAVLCIRYLFRTLAMLLGAVLPCLALLFGVYAIPVILLWGASVPIYISACLYNKVFMQLEAEVMEKLENHNKIPAP